ncbi:S8 family serine peptidase [Candidatus Bathyarchaeota archaeon]|nr:S8 family serine peptidase [Candidatus Bathyarchaeota archaeon]
MKISIALTIMPRIIVKCTNQDVYQAFLENIKRFKNGRTGDGIKIHGLISTERVIILEYGERIPRGFEKIIPDNGEKSEFLVERDVEFILTTRGIKNRFKINEIDGSIHGPFDGNGIKVGIIDEGIDPFNEDIIACLEEQRNFETSDDQEVDLGHGTAIAGLIAGSGNNSRGKYAGLAPKARLFDARAFNARGKGYLSDILLATEWLRSREVRIIVMAFQAVPRDARSSILQDFITRLVLEENIFFCCSGVTENDENGIHHSVRLPGRFEHVFTAGCRRSEKGNRNARGKAPGRSQMVVSPAPGKPDILLPGHGIVSLNTEHSIRKDLVLDKNEFYAIYSGASVATGILAGIIAKIIGHSPYITPMQLKEIITSMHLPVKKNETPSREKFNLDIKEIFMRLGKLHGSHTSYPVITFESLVTTTMLMIFIVALSLFISTVI